MANREVSNSEGGESEEKLSEEEEEEDEEEEEKEEEEADPKREQQGITIYEKQRLSRIAENRARMEALGLSKMASSLLGSSRISTRNSSKLKGKRKVGEDDEDYRPEDDNDDDDKENDDKLESNDDEYDDEEFQGKKTPRSQPGKTKGKSKGLKPKKKASVQKPLGSSDYIENDDELMQAIALSLLDSGEVPGALLTDVKDATRTDRKGNARLKRKKSFTSRVQMTEDEMVAHFFQFDEAEKGSISMRDIRRVATAHDFMWTDKELSDMIYCFDGDGDGKLNLEDFKKIVSRCNMLRTSENS